MCQLNAQPVKQRSKYKYDPFEKEVTLLKGLADIHPYTLVLPDPPPIDEFINYGLHRDQQRFKRTQLPHELKQIDRRVKTGVITRDEGIALIEQDPVLTRFVESLWHKREFGEWQLINGKPLHISPTYWFYLNFWELNIGLPDFRTDFFHYCTDHWLMAWWDYMCVPNPFCDGAVELTQRQSGKTYRAGCIMYEPVSRMYEGHAGIQSKTDDDAEQTFTKAIVKPWRKLPFFFQPICSNSTFPKREGLNFSPRGKKGTTDTLDSMENDELMGSVSFRSSDVMAYDGATLYRYLSDEAGKTVVCDVYERWDVVKPALRRMKGKAYITTTVEEMEKMGGKFFKKMWDDSDRCPTKRNSNEIKVDANGETVSGLWPWFTPAYCNELFDEYGFSIVDTITEKQKDFLRRKGEKIWHLPAMKLIDHMIDKAKDPMKKQAIIRKHPRNIREAFRSSTTFSYFNLEILNERLDRFTYGYTPVEKDYMKFGKFEWVNGVFGGDVEFVPTDYENARFHMSYEPPEGMRNKRIPAPGNKFRPANTALFRSGADPFKYDTVDVKDKKKMSDGAQHIYAFYDELVDGGKERKDWRTNNIVYEYLFRGPNQTVDELCEDYLKACIYYGCKLYPENNNDDVIKYFKKRGFEHYIQTGVKLILNEGGIYFKDEIHGGATTNTKMIEKMFRHVQNFVNEDAKYCVFFRTLQDVKDVERDNLNPYDCFVSLSYTLMAAYETDIANKQLDARKEVDPEVLEMLGWSGN